MISFKDRILRITVSSLRLKQQQTETGGAQAAWPSQWNQMWPAQWNQGTTQISKCGYNCKQE